MEEEGIGLVLASTCIHRATSPNGPSPHTDDDDDDDATERLLNICDALEALETQLSSLQVVWYPPTTSPMESARTMFCSSPPFPPRTHHWNTLPSSSYASVLMLREHVASTVAS